MKPSIRLLVPGIYWVIYFVIIYMITNMFMPVSCGSLSVVLLLLPFGLFLVQFYRGCYRNAIGKIRVLIYSILFFIICLFPVWIAFAVSEHIEIQEVGGLAIGYVLNIVPLTIVLGGITALIYFAVVGMTKVRHGNK